MSDKKIIDYVTFQRMKARLPKKAVLPSPKAHQAVADFCIDSGWLRLWLTRSGT